MEEIKKMTGVSYDRLTDSQIWTDIQKKSLKEDVSDLSDYRERVLHGLSVARESLHDDGVIDSESVKRAHEAAFNDVYFDAGNFRTKVGLFGGNITAEPVRVEREMDLFAAQVEAVNSESSNNLEKLRNIAFTHARFVRIHPFEDGNGRTGRVILDEQIDEAFGVKVGLSEYILEDKPAYIESLKKTYRDRDLAPFAKYLAGCLEDVAPIIDTPVVPDSLETPFNLHPKLATSMSKEDLCSFEEDLEDSRVPGVNLKLDESNDSAFSHSESGKINSTQFE